MHKNLVKIRRVVLGIWARTRTDRKTCSSLYSVPILGAEYAPNERDATSTVVIYTTVLMMLSSLSKLAIRRTICVGSGRTYGLDNNDKCIANLRHITRLLSFGSCRQSVRLWVETRRPSPSGVHTPPASYNVHSVTLSVWNWNDAKLPRLVDNNDVSSAERVLYGCAHNFCRKLLTASRLVF